MGEKVGTKWIFKLRRVTTVQVYNDVYHVYRMSNIELFYVVLLFIAIVIKGEEDCYT